MRVIVSMWSLAATLLIGVTPSFGSTVVFTDRADFMSAVSSAQVVNFEGLISPGTDFGGNGSMTIGGVQFEGVNADGSLSMGIANDEAIVLGVKALDWGSGDSLVFGMDFQPNSLMARLPSGFFAVGFDFFAYDDGDPDGVPSAFRILINEVDLFAGSSLNQPSLSFFGVVSDHAISSARISLDPNDGRPPIPGIDNFVLANPGSVVSPVPTPGTLVNALTGLGILGLVLGLMRKAS